MQGGISDVRGWSIVVKCVKDFLINVWMANAYVGNQRKPKFSTLPLNLKQGFNQRNHVPVLRTVISFVLTQPNVLMANVYARKHGFHPLDGDFQNMKKCPWKGVSRESYFSYNKRVAFVFWIPSSLQIFLLCCLFCNSKFLFVSSTHCHWNSRLK